MRDQAIDDGDKRVSSRAVAALVVDPIEDNVRGLFRAIRVWLQGRDDRSAPGAGVVRSSGSCSEADVVQAIRAFPGDRNAAARALGLSSRFALYRMMKRLKIDDIT